MQAEKCIVNSAACLQAHKTLAFRNSQEKVCELKIDFGIKRFLGEVKTGRPKQNPFETKQKIN